MSIPEMKHFTEHSKKIHKSIAYEAVSWSGLELSHDPQRYSYWHQYDR